MAGGTNRYVNESRIVLESSLEIRFHVGNARTIADLLALLSASGYKAVLTRLDLRLCKCKAYSMEASSDRRLILAI